jgi:arylsulfatase A-like enzyme
VRWPDRFPGGIKVNEAICLTDIFKTLVEITGGELSEGSAEDSYSFLPVLSGEKARLDRPPVIHHSGGKGMFAIRKDHWKMIFGNGSGARTKPVGTPFQEPYQLYDLETDITESNNLIEKESAVAESLASEFFEMKGND